LSLQQSLVQPTRKADGYCRIDVIKWLDVAGPRLWTAAVTDQVFSEVRIDVVQSGKTPLKFYEIRLQNARVENITTAVDTQVTVPSEKLTLAGTSMTLTYAGEKAPVTTNISCK
jgi:type VI protein secretion system component Hcp